jgi:hypothetical protein
MNQEVQFDDGALIDVDTLLSVAHAEASRQRSRVQSATTLNGKPATPG